jgi:hypothetical protein
LKGFSVPPRRGYSVWLILASLGVILLGWAGAQEDTGKAEETGRAQPAKLEPVKAPGLGTSEARELGTLRLLPAPANFESRYTQPIELPQEPTPGLRLGRTTLFPTYTETLTYDDNIFGTKHDKAADLILYSQPGFGLSHRFTENIQLAVNYKFGWNEYLDEKAKDYLTHNADFNLGFKNVGVQGFSLNIYDTYGQTANTGALNESYHAFTRQHQNNSGILANYEQGRIQASASYDFTLVDEFGRNGFDYFYDKVEGLVAYKVTSGLRPYVRYKFLSYDLLGREQNNYTVHEVVGGVKYRPFEQFEFDFGVGNRRSIAVKSLDSDDGEIYRLRLDYAANQNLRAYFQASREFEVGVLVGPTTTTAVEAGMFARILPGLSLGARTGWTRELRGGGIDQRTLQAGALVRYDFRRQFSFYGGYDYTYRETVRFGHLLFNKGVLGFSWRY